MAEFPRLLMLIGAAIPPGRLAASIAAAADAVRSNSSDIEVDIMNLADAPIDISGGRPLDRYGAETQLAVDRIAGAAAVWIAAPVYRASFPGVLKDLVDIAPVGALQGKPVGMSQSVVPPIIISQSIRNCAGSAAGTGRSSPTAVYLTGADFRGRPADVGNCAQGFSRAR
jgi:NADPH-dependent FMN reductase